MSYKIHWKSQRLTALLLALIYPYLVCVFYNLRHAFYGEMIQTFSNPFFATFIALTVLTTLYHAILGLQVIIEDYVKSDFIRKLTLGILYILGFSICLFFFISLIKIMILGTQQ